MNLQKYKNCEYCEIDTAPAGDGARLIAFLCPDHKDDLGDVPDEPDSSSKFWSEGDG